LAITQEGAVIEAQLFPQGDIRDPLGVWGLRHGVTGDGSGGGVKVLYEVTSPKRAAFIYTCYSLSFTQLTGGVSQNNVKARLLTGWPNVDVQQAGVQAAATIRFSTVTGGPNFTPPILGNTVPLVSPEQRFILLFDPRSAGLDLVIAEVEWENNTEFATYSFEGWGYYWDRSVLQAPGGPRHPGAS